MSLFQKLHGNALGDSKPIQISSEGACPIKEEVEYEVEEERNLRDAMRAGKEQREKERMCWSKDKRLKANIKLSFLIEAL